MMSFASRFLALTTLALTAGGCGSDSTVATSDDVEQARARHYRIGAVELPTSSVRARELAFDLDDDGTVDNLLGMLHMTMTTQSTAYQVMPGIAEALASDLVWTLTVYDDAESGVIYGAHLAQGRLDERGAAVPELGELPPAFADLADEAVPLTGELGQLPLGTFSDALGGAAPGWVDGWRLHIDLETITDDAVTARIGMAVPEAATAQVVVPNLAAYFTSRLQANDSDFAAEADTDDDGVVSEAEMAATSAVEALLYPDLVGRSSLGGDALSIGFAVTATR